MLIYIVVIDFDVDQAELGLGCPVFDSVHTNKESADKRCVDIMNGVNVTYNIELALRTYEDNKSYKDFIFFEAEVIPVQLEPNQPIAFLMTDKYRSGDR